MFHKKRFRKNNKKKVLKISRRTRNMKKNKKINNSILNAVNHIFGTNYQMNEYNIKHESALHFQKK